MLFSCFLINCHSWVLSFLVEMKIWTFDPSYLWKGGFIWEYYYKISFLFSFCQILVYVLLFLLVKFWLTLTPDVWVPMAKSFAHTCKFTTKKTTNQIFQERWNNCGYYYNGSENKHRAMMAGSGPITDSGGNCSKTLLQGKRKILLPPMLLSVFGWRRIHK